MVTTTKPASPDGQGSDLDPARDARPSLAAGVIANWTWYALVVVSGLVLPRVIAEYQGKELLGVWDLGWSILFYVSFLKMSAGGAVTRYVSRYRALGDWSSFNATVNGSLLFLTAGGLLGAMIACLLGAWTHVLLPGASNETIRTAAWIIVLLGCGAALEMPLGAFNAVITGFQRFDLLNWIRGARDVAVFVGMLAVLCAGGTLISSAVVMLAGTIVFGGIQVLVARRLCPQWRLSWRTCTWSSFRNIAAFGSKSMSRDVARSLLYQLNGVLVGVFLGPAVLAVYTRQRNLVMQVLKLIKQFAQVFIPASSGLDARGDHEGLQGMLIRSAQYGMYLTLPMTVVLVILGGPLVRLWMGPGFEAPGVLAILAIGHLLSVAQLGPYSILEGMGRHGRPAIFELSGAVFGVALTWFGLSTMNWSMQGAALAVALAVGVSTGVVMPWYACRVVGLPISVYAKEVFPKPFLAVLPFAAGLGVAVWLSAVSPALALATSLAGVLGTGGLYVTWALPEGFATAFKERVESVWGQWRTRGRADVS